MIIISAGMPKAGSALHFNLINDLLIASGKQDVRIIKEKYNLEHILKEHNCNIGELYWYKFKKLTRPLILEKSFVVKTHNPPTKTARILMLFNMVKGVCIYRDPRDVLLSAIEHGERIRASGQNHSFASCRTVEDTIPKVINWLDNIVLKWLSIDNVLCVKYEDLIENPIEELIVLAKYLKLNHQHIDFEMIYQKYLKKNLGKTEKNFLHFGHGVVGRHNDLLKKDDLDLCNSTFYPYLTKLGYISQI